MAPTPSKNFLVSKAGPLPVWGWGGIVLGGAYAYSKYKASKASKAATTSDTAPTVPGALNANGEPVSGAPTYLIENNIPGGYSTPITSPPPVGTPVVGPPSTTPSPPVSTPVAIPPLPMPTNTPGPTPPPSAPPPPRPAPPPTPRPHVPVIVGSTTHRVQAGDSFSKIASEYHIPGGWQELYAYNTNPKYNSAYATFKKQGPNLLYANQTVHVPEYR